MRVAGSIFALNNLGELFWRFGGITRRAISLSILGQFFRIIVTFSRQLKQG